MVFGLLPVSGTGMSMPVLRPVPLVNVETLFAVLVALRLLFLTRRLPLVRSHAY